MLEKLIAAVTDWPVIVQGALGSALFTAVVIAGQKLAPVVSTKFSESSKKRRRDFLFQQRLKYGYRLTKNNTDRGAILTALMYLASRSAVKAAIWLTLGILASTFFPVFGAVGALGCLYYLFNALSIVNPAPQVSSDQERFEALGKEMEELGEPPDEHVGAA